MSETDHHSRYLARAVEALTPAGRSRVDEILEQLGEAAGGRERLVAFAKARETEADLGRVDVTAVTRPEPVLTRAELDALIAGFMTIRDQEPLDDVGDWANAVLALLEDEAAHTPQ
jgi:hypothetical protein